MEKRECKRCLLRELSEKDYRENVEKYINSLKPEDRIESGSYEQRLDICKACDFLNAGTCNACGCYVEIRAAAKNSSCPKKRW